MILNEVTRQQHLNKTKASDLYVPGNQFNGKNRYERRLHQKVSSSTAEYNRMDMNKFFSQNILDVNILVHGETNDYTVRISFGDILDNLKQEVQSNNEILTLRVVLRALIKSFNGDDVKVRCSCEDFLYRQSYWLSVNGGIAGEPETRPSNITNPNDTKGSGCKHILMVLSNNSWLQKVAAVIFNYTNYMKEHYENLYAKIIYPAIYGKEYTEPVQMDLFEPDELATDQDTIDTSNVWARTKNQFKQGNEYRFKSDDLIKGQRSFDFDSLVSDN